MLETVILQKLLFLPPLWLSLTVHEWAHAISAYKLGDDTAAREGRLTLNPLSHIDPIGSILVPLFVPFGWARPVPIVPRFFDRKVRMRTGIVLSAVAGPASNVVLALVCLIVMGTLLKLGIHEPAVWDLLNSVYGLNVLLALFNMLPFPPLDGGRVADGMMPARFERRWERVAQQGPMLLLAVVILPSFLGFSIFRYPMSLAYRLGEPLVLWIGHL